jgi:uncharacterized membrane-anchored protein
MAFWFAYVVTRPLGATVADWLGKPELGGLGLGDGPVALVLGLLTIACVADLTVSHTSRVGDRPLRVETGSEMSERSRERAPRLLEHSGT